MATSKPGPNKSVRNPVKRRGAYPDQKAMHPNETNFVERTILPCAEFCIQTNGRHIVYPVLKKICSMECENATFKYQIN